MTENQKDYKKAVIKEMGKLRGSINARVEGVSGSLDDTNDAISRVVEAIDRVAEAIDQHRLELSRYSGIPVEITNLRHQLDASMEDLSRKVSVLDMGGSK